MYQAVVCDMDGTLLNTDHRISERTKKAIQNVLNKGVKVFLASGRPYADIKYFRDKLGLDSYIISSNGAVVYDEKDNEIMAYPFEKEILGELLDLPHKDLHRNLYTKQSWFVEDGLEELLEFHKESGFAFTVVPDLAEQNKGEGMKLFFLSWDENALGAFEEKLIAEFGDRVSITLSTPFCLEVMKKGVTKGKAVADTMKLLGIPMEKVVAFGDGLNDYEMLASVGCPFVMSNGSPRLLAALSEARRAPSNGEDGVAQCLEEIFMNR